MKTGSSRLGLGGEAGQVLVIAGPALAAAVVGTIVQPQAFTFLGPWWGAGIAAGIVWNAVGLLFWGVAAVDLVVAFRADALATKRSFGLVRHPIFAWWLWFLVPGAALILNSWLFILADIAFFIGAVRGARAEEAALTARYGAAYDAYRSRVRMLVPIPHLRPLTIRRLVAFAGGGAVAVVAAVLGFALVARPVMLGYGQGKLETTVFAGDDYVRSVRSGYTQVYEIDAPPAAVWPWLIQVGYGRAGWYNVDAINRLASSEYFYEGGRSARRVIPELQSLAPGDTIYLVPQVGQEVVELVPGERLLLVGNPRERDAAENASWLFELREQPGEDSGPSRTLLVVRFRSTFAGGLGARLVYGLVNEIGGAIIQQPAMAWGLARRATGRL